MPFENESFDAAYAIEATCHARDLRNPYGQVYQKLKPGAYFACYEWLVTPSYDPENPKHREVIHDLEKGNGISKLFGIPDCLEALRDVGFEIIEHKDLSIVQESQEPWYVPLKGSYSLSFDQLYRWRMNPLGRSITNVMVYGLETLRLVPKGTVKVSQFLNNGADALVKAGEMEIFTPMFFFLARKPE
jgi:sterol 24-C-methyltransferase